MDYNKLSDFEINCAVAGALNMPPWPRYGYAGTQLEPYTAAICHGGGRLGGFDPCNSWADAGPIIQTHRIHLNPLWASDWCATTECDSYREINKNPLRAAMIVFLMANDKGE